MYDLKNEYSHILVNGKVEEKDVSVQFVDFNIMNFAIMLKYKDYICIFQYNDYILKKVNSRQLTCQNITNGSEQFTILLPNLRFVEVIIICNYLKYLIID